MDSSIKISIIIPVYNLSDVLSKCLDSILNQTYKNLEIIVISDGSTDGSNNIIRKYSMLDNRIVPIFKENTGVSDTRNKGLEIATGDYIGFVDGDDYVEPEMFETLLSNALKYNADISHCGYQMVFPSRVDYYYNTEKFVEQDTEKGLYDLLTGEYVEPGLWIKLYKRDLLRDIKMPTDIKYNEDVLFNVYAFSKSKLSVYYDKAYYHQILRKSSATHQINENKIMDPYRVSIKIVDYLKNDSEKIRNMSMIRFANACIGVFKFVKLNKLSEYYEDAKKVIKHLRKTKFDFQLPMKLKLQKFLVCYCSELFVFVCKLYGIISKSKNKYEVK